MIHVGVIGGGNISDTHARAAGEIAGVEVSAICGYNPDKTARLAQLYGGAVYSDLSAFLKHKPMEVVMIGSPSGLHAEQGIAAARAGLHVLVEKPIDITTARADALIFECDRARVKLGICYQDRMAPDVASLKQFLDKGGLGQPILASGKVKWFRPPEYYADSRWRGTKLLDGGGALINQGVHTVDLLLWLMGNITRVQARSITALHDIDVEDTVVATLEFENGAVGTLEATTAAFPGYKRRVEITGSAGTITLEHDCIVGADLRDAASFHVTPSAGDSNQSANSPVVSDVGGHKRILEDFLQAIESDGKPRCDGRDGRRSLAVVEAIYESSQTGRAVTLPAN